MTRFSELIQELGNALQLSLVVDRHDACTLQVHQKIRIQLQQSPDETMLFLACLAMEIPPGKFRENVLKEALKANHLPDPRPATLSYVAQNNHLALCQIFPMEILNGQRLAGYLALFLGEAESWIQALEEGRSGPILGVENRKILNLE